MSPLTPQEQQLKNLASQVGRLAAQDGARQGWDVNQIEAESRRRFALQFLGDPNDPRRFYLERNGIWTGIAQEVGPPVKAIAENIRDTHEAIFQILDRAAPPAPTPAPIPVVIPLRQPQRRRRWKGKGGLRRRFLNLRVRGKTAEKAEEEREEQERAERERREREERRAGEEGAGREAMPPVRRRRRVREEQGAGEEETPESEAA